MTGLTPQEHERLAVHYDAQFGRGLDDSRQIVTDRLASKGVEYLRAKLAEWDQRAAGVSNGGHGLSGPSMAELMKQPPPPGELKEIATFRFFHGIEPDFTDHELVAGGVLENRGVSLVTGAPGAGKTNALVDLSVGVASGTDWLGMPCRQGGVIYVASEAGDSIMNRFAVHRRTDRGKRVGNLAVVPHRINIASGEDMSEFAHQIKPMGAALIVFDTLSRSIVGVDENSVEQMTQITDNLSCLYHSTGAAVVVAHHLGKIAERGARGHSVLIANTDCEIRIERKDDHFVLKVERQRNAIAGKTVAFKLQSVFLGTSDRGNKITAPICEVIAAPEQTEKSTNVTIADAMLRELTNMASQDAYRVPIQIADGVPPGTHGVKKPAWKQRVIHIGIINSEGANPSAQFNTMVSRLVNRQAIRIAGEIVWAVQGG